MIGFHRRRLLSIIFVVLAGASSCGKSASDEAAVFLVEQVRLADTSLEGENGKPFRGKPWGFFTLGGETRRALAPPFPSQVSFELKVPQDPVLRFAIAASTMGRATLSAPVEFRLFVDAGAGRELLLDETVRRAEPNRWLPREVDLSRWTGSTVRLVFETRSGGRAPSPGRYALPLWGNPVLASRSRVPSRPNLILISVDCLRADHLSAYGYERQTTPSIDTFSQDAVLFRTAVSASLYTLPTHASMLTGLPPSMHGATAGTRLSSSVPYLPELLAETGYRVNGVVSAPFLSQNYAFHRGFHTYRVVGGRARRLVEEALQLLQEGEGQSQFLFLHLFDAHWPYSPPREFITRFGERPPDISDLLGRVRTRSPPQSQVEIDQLINLYDGEIAYLDQELGRFFDALRASGLYDTSLIILTADHGEAFYEHGYWEHPRWDSDWGPYEEIVRIPLIVKWPGESSPVEIGGLVSQMDVTPTMLEAAGLERPMAWATSLRRSVSWGSRGSDSRTVLTEFVSRANRGALMHIALRDQDSKYVASLRSPTVDGLYTSKIYEEKLYDIRNDPFERENLLPSSNGNLGPFRDSLRAYLGEALRRRLQLRGERVTLDEAVLEQLESLGYLKR